MKLGGLGLGLWWYMGASGEIEFVAFIPDGSDGLVTDDGDRFMVRAG